MNPIGRDTVGLVPHKRDPAPTERELDAELARAISRHRRDSAAGHDAVKGSERSEPHGLQRKSKREPRHERPKHHQPET